MGSMALASFPPDGPATHEAETLLGPADSALRAHVREAAAAAQRGEPALSAAAARERLLRMPQVAAELRALDQIPPDLGL
jgi:hypothetical protein